MAPMRSGPPQRLLKKSKHGSRNGRPLGEGRLEGRNNVQFDEVVVDGGARAEFEAVADFVAEGVEGVGGAETPGTAGHAFALGDKAVAAGFHCYVESHCDHLTASL